MRNFHLFIPALLLLLTANPSSAQTVTLSVGEASGAADAEAEVPITISGSKKAGPMQFILLYDPEILEAIADPPGVEARGVVFGEVVENGGMLEQSVIAPGELYVRFVTEDPVDQDGELLKIRFKVIGENGNSCALSLEAPEIWEKETFNEVRVSTVPGRFTVGNAGGLPLPLPLLVAIGAGVLLLILIILFAKRSKVSQAPTAPAPKPAPASNPAPNPAGSPQAPQPAPATADDPIAKLKQLKELLESEIITEEEFETKKQQLLDQM